ncbi:hypothetical protein niasHT_024491 [Heterodera trifolii]|uniref:Cadherin domain-containing protein n=1 Tax=Heterodera trifolii TaxID=157864 RepID=A0ABD2K764_9BILA
MKLLLLLRFHLLLSFPILHFIWPIFASSSFGQINASSDESLAMKWHRSHSQEAKTTDETDQSGLSRHNFDHQYDEHDNQPVCLLERDRSAIYMSMAENAKKGAILGTLPIIGRSGGPKPTMELNIVKGREFVRLNAFSKQLILRKAIDREQKGMEQLEAIIECVPLTPVPQNLEIFPLNISVFITVTDLNDNAPQFGARRFAVQIAEELPEGTPIRLDFRATDADQPGPNSRIRYRIVRSPPPAAETAAAAEEQKHHQQQQRECSQSADEELTVSGQSSSDDRLPFEVFYTDSDDDCAALLLHIQDPLRPELFVAGRIDFEKMPNFTVFIEAEDQGTPKLRTFARLDVTVIDVDDLNPTFGAQMYKSSEHRGFSLAIEPSPIKAWDADRSFDEPIIYTLSGEHAVNYAIDQLTGEVKLLAEKLVPANLIVQARQANRSERNSTAFLLVQPPPAGDKEAKGEGKSSELIILRLPKNTAIGTKLMRLVDDEKCGTESAERKGEALGLEIVMPKGQKRNKLPFFIDQRTKWLRLAKRMEIGQYAANISIKLTCPKLPPTIRSLDIRLTIFDPIRGQNFAFEKQIYEFELPVVGENDREQSVEIGRIKAKNAGARGNGTAREEADQLITYALLSGNDLFHIHPIDGVLRLLPTKSAELFRLPPATELVALAENSAGGRDFALCIVRRPTRSDVPPLGTVWPPSLTPPDTALCLGLLCFLLLLTNCATLSLWLGKRRMANLYEKLAAYRYDSMCGLAEGRRTQNANGKNGSFDWRMNRALEGDGAVTIANWVGENSGRTTTWRTTPSSTTEEGGRGGGRDLSTKVDG